MNMRQTLYHDQKLSQQLSIAPQLLNWLQLLQAPTMELSGMIQHELATNPVLEIDSPDSNTFDESPNTDAEYELQNSDTTFDDSNLNQRLETLTELDQDWREDYAQSKASAQSGSAEDNEKHQFVLDSLVDSESLYSFLQKQLGQFELTSKMEALAEQIIGSLDDRGYLSVSLVDLAEEAGVSTPDMQQALKSIQSMHPIGVGARDLRECLMLQIENKEDLAYRLLDECFDLLAERNLDEVMARLSAEREDICEALSHIQSLNPEPGLSIVSTPTPYVEADVFVTEKEGILQADTNDDQMPRLRISPSCRALLERGNLSPEDLAYIRQKIRSGQFLIRGIHQRKETLLRVTKEILRVQNTYFKEEAGEMVPLTMNKVAAIIGVHETTVSRAISNKYMSTSKGLIPMKAFFKSGYRCADGSAWTPERVKEVIDELVEHEKQESPLTDQHISSELKEKGLKVARRTIAKYREELGIPSSKERAKQFRLSQKALQQLCVA